MALNELLERLSDSIAELSARLAAQDWSRNSSQATVRALKQSIQELGEMQALIALIPAQAESESITIETQVLENDLNKLLEFLERNLMLEEGRSESLSIFASEVSNLKQKELYSNLQERIKASIVKARLFAEKAMLETRTARTESKTFTGSNAAASVLQALKEKETELQGLKEKFDDLKVSSLASKFENSSIELEEELNETARSLEIKASDFQKLVENNKKQVENATALQQSLMQKARVLDESLSNFMGKSLELITSLKKERDKAKETLLEIQQASSHLQRKYSEELLKMQETKMQFQKEAQEKFGRKIRELEKELRQGKELIEEFRKIASNKEEKIQKLEEKIESLQLLHKHLEKHAKIKARHEKHDGKKKTKSRKAKKRKKKKARK